MKKLINYRPVPIFFLFIIVGILLVSLLNLVYGLVAIGISIVALIVVFSAKKLRKHISKIVLIMTALIIGVTSCAVTLGVISSNNEYVPDVYITGTISGDTMFSSGGNIIDNHLVLTDVSYEGNIGMGSVDGKVLIKIPSFNSSANIAKVGDIITVFGTLVPSQLIVTDSYSVSNYTSGIRYSASGEMFKNTLVNEIDFFDNIKVKAKTVMLKFMTDDSAELIYSMVFGDSSNMNNHDLKAFREIGIAHLFAVSGLHIAVLVGAISFIIRKCKGGKYVDYFISLAVVLFYAALTGFGVSVMRAMIMLVVYKTGKLLNYKHCGISSVCLAGSIILAFNPIMMFSLSFQLSLLAIVGIYFFSEPIAQKLKFLPSSLAVLVSLNISVNIAIIPIILKAFGDVSLIFLLANILLVPIITLLFPIVLLFLFISTLIPILGYILIPFGYIFEVFTFVSSAIASLTFLSVSVVPSVPMIVGYMLFLVLVSKYIMIEGRTRAIISGAGIIVFTSCVFISSYHLIDFATKVNVVSSSMDHEYVVVNDYGGDNYLIINGEYDEYIIRDVIDYMDKYNITHFDGIIKPTFTDKEVLALYKTFEYIQPEYIITYTKHHYFDYLFEDRQYLFCDNDDIFVTMHSYGDTDQVMVSIGEINIGFSNIIDYDGEIYFNHNDNIDILFANGDRDYIDYLLPDYYISDFPYTTISKTIASKFTIKINKDKIYIR